MFQRIIDLNRLIKNRSIFLLGPRQTGKSTLLKQTFPDALYIDLLEGRTYRDLSFQLEKLEDFIVAHIKSNIVIIDEIQKLPELLDEVHRLIEKYKEKRFILTGSSARKLKRTGVNLLGGRARLVHFYPLVYPEVITQKNVSPEIVLTRGGLPSILLSKEPKEDLKSYIGLYLQEEIKAEGLARNIGSFSRFLETAALTNGEQVNLKGVGEDAQVPPRTVADYYKILEDTLVGTMLEPYRKTKTRKAVAIAKFYFFDVGVANALLGRSELKAGTQEYGRALEHYVYCELRSYINYRGLDAELYYWRSTSKFEVDFVIKSKKRMIGIEVKASRNVSSSYYKGLTALEEDCKGLRKIIVCNEAQHRVTPEKIDIYPIFKFCEDLWAGNIF